MAFSLFYYAAVYVFFPIFQSDVARKMAVDGYEKEKSTFYDFVSLTHARADRLNA